MYRLSAVKSKQQRDRVDTNSSWLMVFETEKENEELASNHAVAARAA